MFYCLMYRFRYIMLLKHIGFIIRNGTINETDAINSLNQPAMSRIRARKVSKNHDNNNSGDVGLSSDHNNNYNWNNIPHHKTTSGGQPTEHNQIIKSNNCLLADVSAFVTEYLNIYIYI